MGTQNIHSNSLRITPGIIRTIKTKDYSLYTLSRRQSFNFLINKYKTYENKFKYFINYKTETTLIWR